MFFPPIARNAIAPLSWLRRRKPECHVQCLWGGTRGIMLWSLSFFGCFWGVLYIVSFVYQFITIFAILCKTTVVVDGRWSRSCVETKHWSIGGDSGDGAVSASPMQKEHCRKKVAWNGPKPIWWTTKTGGVISPIIILPPQYETHPKEPGLQGIYTNWDPFRVCFASREFIPGNGLVDLPEHIAHIQCICICIYRIYIYNYINIYSIYIYIHIYHYCIYCINMCGYIFKDTYCPMQIKLMLVFHIIVTLFLFDLLSLYEHIPMK